MTYEMGNAIGFSEHLLQESVQDFGREYHLPWYAINGEEIMGSVLNSGIRVRITENPGAMCAGCCPRETVRERDFGRELICTICGSVWHAFEYEMARKGREVTSVNPETSCSCMPGYEGAGSVVSQAQGQRATCGHRSWCGIMEALARDMEEELDDYQREAEERARERASRPDPYALHRAQIPEHVERTTR